MPAGPTPFLKAVASYRAGLVVCGECVVTWYWLADLYAREGIAFVLGHIQHTNRLYNLWRLGRTSLTGRTALASLSGFLIRPCRTVLQRTWR